MPMAAGGFDTFVSPRLSLLTHAGIQSIAKEFPERRTWLTGFVARHIFNNHVPEQLVPLSFALLRRAEAAADEWEAACDALAQLAQEKTVSGYFRALRHVENAVAALYQGLEFGRHGTKTPLFKRGDGSVYERLNFIYNTARHFDPTTLPQGELHAIWLTNEGISTREKAITYAELRGVLCELGRVANALSTGQFPRPEELQPPAP